MKNIVLIYLLLFPATFFAQEMIEPLVVSVVEPPYYAYDSVTTKPSFPGSTTAMNAWIDSAKATIHTSDSGIVHVWFVIEKNGMVNNVRVTKATGKSLDAEAERIISLMPAWIPGKKNGVDVATEVILEVRF